MSLEEVVRAELVQLRKSRDGVTVEAITHAPALSTALGDGDPRLAYNALKHIVLSLSDRSSVTAAAYSLGFASDGATHLDRLSDFGSEHGYDQRHARRYSDKGLSEIARLAVSAWTIDNSPTLEATILPTGADVLELLIRTQRLSIISMRDPILETVNVDTGERLAVVPDWHEQLDDAFVRATAHVMIPQPPAEAVEASIRWQGEVWPRYVAITPDVPTMGRFIVETLGARLRLRRTLSIRCGSR